jgi:hypothetical protein
MKLQRREPRAQSQQLENQEAGSLQHLSLSDSAQLAFGEERLRQRSVPEQPHGQISIRSLWVRSKRSGHAFEEGAEAECRRQERHHPCCLCRVNATPMSDHQRHSDAKSDTDTAGKHLSQCLPLSQPMQQHTERR